MIDLELCSRSDTLYLIVYLCSNKYVEKSKMFVYLDNQASTPVDSRIIQKMLPYMSEVYGNPHSNDHFFGWESQKAVVNSRKQLARFLKSDPEEIVFTSGATEANNLAILGLLPKLKALGKRKILISELEHKCVLECALFAQKQGFEINYLKSNKAGFIDHNKLSEIIDEEVGLISVMAVNNEIGTIQPIKLLCEIAHKFGAFFHTDAAQAAIFMDLDVKNLGVDILTLSSHKIYGPKGIGCAYIKRDIHNLISPLIHGGGQENGLRSGTVPTTLCVGFGEACAFAQEEREGNVESLKNLSNLFWNNLIEKYPQAVLNGSKNNRHPGNLNIEFPGIDAHSLLQSLQPHVAASTGSACNTGNLEPSYVLKAIGLTENSASSSIRFSFGAQNNHEQIIQAVVHIVKAIERLSDTESF